MELLTKVPQVPKWPPMMLKQRAILAYPIHKVF